MNKGKILSYWSFLGLPAVCIFVFQGCSWAPGLQVDAVPSGLFESKPTTEAIEKPEFVLVPMTSKLVAEMESKSTGPKREAPSQEWFSDPVKYKYLVGPQDLLQIVVWDHPELSITETMTGESQIPESFQEVKNADGTGGGSVAVGHDGTIFFPFAGTLPVTGKTPGEIRALLTEALSTYYTDPQVDVKVVGFRSKKVHVTGEVAQPRDIAITDVPLRLLDAISTAGGTTQTAALDHLRVIRGNRHIWLSLLDIYDNARPDENILLQDGDIVHVANVSILERIFVMGEVQSQGVTALQRGKLTLAEALQSAGGINQESADAARVLVLRKGEQKPLVYWMDANKPENLVLATRFPLQQSDIVYVATSEIHRLGKVMRTLLIPAQFGNYAAAAAR